MFAVKVPVPAASTYLQTLRRRRWFVRDPGETVRTVSRAPPADVPDSRAAVSPGGPA